MSVGSWVLTPAQWGTGTSLEILMSVGSWVLTPAQWGTGWGTGNRSVN